MPYFVHRTIVALPQLFQRVHFIEGDVETTAAGEIDSSTVDDRLAVKFERTGLGINKVGKLVE